MLTRRAWLRTAAGSAALLLTGRAAFAAAGPPIRVYKSPTCGCCGKWVDHLRENGFEVTTHDLPDVAPIKTRHGVPAALASCHTGVVDGYVVEGHVPAGSIRKLLAERPEGVGLAVPGMPIGSPGMEIPGRSADRFEVVLFRADGTTRVFASY